MAQKEVGQSVVVVVVAVLVRRFGEVELWTTEPLEGEPARRVIVRGQGAVWALRLVGKGWAWAAVASGEGWEVAATALREGEERAQEAPQVTAGREVAASLD